MIIVKTLFKSTKKHSILDQTNQSQEHWISTQTNDYSCKEELTIFVKGYPDIRLFLLKAHVRGMGRNTADCFVLHCYGQILIILAVNAILKSDCPTLVHTNQKMKQHKILHGYNKMQQLSKNEEELKTWHLILRSQFWHKVSVRLPVNKIHLKRCDDYTTLISSTPGRNNNWFEEKKAGLQCRLCNQ